jgi:hypothetical protein
MGWIDPAQERHRWRACRAVNRRFTQIAGYFVWESVSQQHNQNGGGICCLAEELLTSQEGHDSM